MKFHVTFKVIEFQVLKTYMVWFSCVYEGIFCSHFVRKLTLTPGLLDTVP